jgi:hypothetical protein
MGLLDEAIREHLELKRRSGADPSAVAREEREALAPVLEDDSLEEQELESYVESELAPASSQEVAPAAAHPVEDEHFADLSNVGQETAELDMQAVMEEDPDAADSASPLGPIVDGPTPPAYSGQTRAEEGLDWGFPKEHDPDPAPEDTPGQERLTFE